MNHRPSARRKLSELPMAQLVERAGRFVRPPGEEPQRARAFTPWTTFWLFLAQVLDGARTCREALRHAQVWLDKELSSSTSAYCQARRRLPQAHLDHALESVVRHLSANERKSCAGRRVLVVDGSSCSMPDTPANQAKYPQPSAQKPGCGFPVMRFVALFSLGTGALLGATTGALAVHERALWRQLWALLTRGDIVLGDRGFGSYAEFFVLTERGVDCVMRLQQQRKVARRLRRLGKNDWIVEWLKASTLRPKWMESGQWNKLPNTLRVRIVKFAVPIAGFRAKTITIATTLLDGDIYTARMMTDLFRQRWMAELYLRDIKITMGMDVLRCKTPALIQKEFTMHLIAYNLARALMLEAATRNGAEPLRISVAGTIATIRQWAPGMARCPKQKRAETLQAFLRVIAADIIPLRPNRLEPRARKRRPKNYPLLTINRHQFKEIPHRNRYHKALS